MSKSVGKFAARILLIIFGVWLAISLLGTMFFPQGLIDHLVSWALWSVVVVLGVGGLFEKADL